MHSLQQYGSDTDSLHRPGWPPLPCAQVALLLWLHPSKKFSMSLNECHLLTNLYQAYAIAMLGHRRDTAVMALPNPSAPGGEAMVYILGVSHVSRESCERTQELIERVRPGAVLLEVCKDRLGLLIDRGADAPQLWHSRCVRITGIPEGDAGALLRLTYL